MAPWGGSDFFQGDSTIETAMMMLVGLGLGPEDYVERFEHQKTACMTLSDEGEWVLLAESGPLTTRRDFESYQARLLAKLKAFKATRPAGAKTNYHQGRHTPAEYAEFFACWRAATDAHEVVEAKFMELLEFGTAYAEILDENYGERPVFGHAYHFLILLLMQNGCALPPGFKTKMLESLARDAWATNPMAYARRILVRKVRDLLLEYDERGGSRVEYRVPSFAEVGRETHRRLAAHGQIEQGEDEKREEKQLAEAFDGRVRRSTFERGPPPELFSRMAFDELSATAEGRAQVEETRKRYLGDKPSLQTAPPLNDEHRGSRGKHLEHHPGKVDGALKRTLKENVGATFDVEQSCAKCGKWDYGFGADVTLRRCVKCLTIYYCSKECQVGDWSEHKNVCKTLRAKRDAARASESDGDLAAAMGRL